MYEGGVIVVGGDIVVVGWFCGFVYGGWNGDRGVVVYVM